MENIFKFRQYIFAISLLFALGKRRALHLKRLETYLFVPSLIEIGPVVLENNIFLKLEVYRQTVGQTTEDRQSKKLFQFSARQLRSKGFILIQQLFQCTKLLYFKYFSLSKHVL